MKFGFKRENFFLSFSFSLSKLSKDTAGREEFRSLTPMYYRGTNLVFIVFDLTSETSFERSKKYFEDVVEHEKGKLMVVVGNKKDLERQVDKKQVENFCEEKSAVYFEMSGKDVENVKELFEICGKLSLLLRRKAIKGEVREKRMEEPKKQNGFFSFIKSFF